MLKIVVQNFVLERQVFYPCLWFLVMFFISFKLHFLCAHAINSFSAALRLFTLCLVILFRSTSKTTLCMSKSLNENIFSIILPTTLCHEYCTRKANNYIKAFKVMLDIYRLSVILHLRDLDISWLLLTFKVSWNNSSFKLFVFELTTEYKTWISIFYRLSLHHIFTNSYKKKTCLLLCILCVFNFKHLLAGICEYFTLCRA